MQPLLTFACLSMCVTALLALLPEGSGLRRTALLAAGLMLASIWLSSVHALWPQWSPGEAADTLLTQADTEPMDARQQALMQQMREEMVHGQAANMAAP